MILRTSSCADSLLSFSLPFIIFVQAKSLQLTTPIHHLLFALFLTFPAPATQSFTWFTWTATYFTFTSSLDSHSTQSNDYPIMTKNWEKEKERMHELYLLPLLLFSLLYGASTHETRYITRNMKLASVIDIMIKQYGFQASYVSPCPPSLSNTATLTSFDIVRERAYKQKFKEWQWFKKTQASIPSPVYLFYAFYPTSPFLLHEKEEKGE